MARLTHGTVALAVTICILGWAAPASAQKDALTITGHWIGFGQSPSGPVPIPYPVVADISPLNGHRRFSVTLELPALQQGLTISGTVAASGNVNIEGGDGGIHFSAHGRFVEAGPGPQQLPAVGLAALKYHVEAGPGPSQDGFILLVQAQGGPNWSGPGPIQDISGAWTGDYVSDRPGGGCDQAGGALVMNLIQQRSAPGADQGGTLTSAFGGTLEMDNVSVQAGPGPQSLNLTFDAVGTVGAPSPNHGAPFVLIGLAAPPDPELQSGGIIAVLIGLAGGGPQGFDAITGDYALYGSFFDVFSEIWRGSTSSFDMGEFMVTRDPGPAGQ